MPDRNDPTQYGYINELGDFAQFPTGVPDGAPATHHDQFGVQAYDLPDGDVVNSQPAHDILNDHPEQFFTAYRDQVSRITQYFPLVNVSGLVQSGPQTLAGFSAIYTGATGPILIRDGLDASSPIVGVIPGGSMYNQWFGLDGPRLKFGLFLDLSQAGPVGSVNGCVYLARNYAN